MLKYLKERVCMKKMRYLRGRTLGILCCLFLYFSMTALAAPAVEGDTDVTSTTDGTVSADYVITNDTAMERVSITLSYDKEVLTYLSGSGGDNFSGNGGNGAVQLSSNPNDTTASFSVRFRGKEDTDTKIEITSCVITVDGEDIDVLNQGESSSSHGEAAEGDEDDEERASFVIDERTFYVRRPDDIEGFDAVHLDIQGIDSRALKHQSLDIYVVRLRSDNGSYRDDFVYNPDTGNVIPFVQMESGKDQVIFIEPVEGGYIPTRYSYVDMPWGPKYTIPAYKHVIIDGVDEFFDDTNRYLVYGINQDGEKAWYSYDYDKECLQAFDDMAYQGEQNYILDLEESVEGMRAESANLLKRYDTNMGRRLMIILTLIIIIVILLNAVVLLYLRMRRMQLLESEEEDTEELEDTTSNRRKKKASAYVTGNLEENETDFREPEEDEEEDIELEIIDLDNLDEED